MRVGAVLAAVLVAVLVVAADNGSAAPPVADATRLLGRAADGGATARQPPGINHHQHLTSHQTPATTPRRRRLLQALDDASPAPPAPPAPAPPRSADLARRYSRQPADLEDDAALAANSRMARYGLSRPRTAAERERAQQLLNSGHGRLYFEHLRKAGGTSMREHLNSLFPGTPLMHSEFSKIRLQCMPDAYNNTIFVTVLRHPVCRALSEFFYLGQRLVRAPAGHAGVDETLELWMSNKFMDDVVRINRELAAGVYRPNYMVRHFGGGDCPPAHCPPARDLSKESDGKSLANLSCNGHNDTVLDEQDLANAKHALRQFDGVLIVEWAHTQPAMLAAFHHGVTGKSAHVQFAHSNAHHGSATHTCDERGHVEGIRKDLVERLHRENFLDIQFYDFARQECQARIRTYLEAYPAADSRSPAAGH